MSLNIVEALNHNAQLAGYLASEAEDARARVSKMAADLDEMRGELAQRSRDRDTMKGTREQLVALAYPGNVIETRMTPPTLQDCIGQIRRSLSQAERDRVAVESYQKRLVNTQITNSSLRSSLREARDMLMNDQSSPALNKALADRITPVLLEAAKTEER